MPPYEQKTLVRIAESRLWIRFLEDLSELLTAHVDLEAQKEHVDRVHEMIPLTLGKCGSTLLVHLHSVHEITQGPPLCVLETVQLRIHVIHHVGVELSLLFGEVQKRGLQVVQMMTWETSFIQ